MSWVKEQKSLSSLRRWNQLPINSTQFWTEQNKIIICGAASRSHLWNFRGARYHRHVSLQRALRSPAPAPAHPGTHRIHRRGSGREFTTPTATGHADARCHRCRWFCCFFLWVLFICCFLGLYFFPKCVNYVNCVLCWCVFLFEHLLLIYCLLWWIFHGSLFMASQPTPLMYIFLRNKGWMRPFFEGNQWVFTSPDHKAGYFCGGTLLGGSSQLVRG